MNRTEDYAPEAAADLKLYTRRLIEDAKGDIVKQILTTLERQRREDRAELERIVTERTFDAVVKNGALERTKAMMRMHKS